MKNKEILDTFNQLSKVKKMGERTQDLIEGITKKVKLKVEMSISIIARWDEGEDCTIEFDYEDCNLDNNLQLKKITKQLQDKTNEEIKQICDLSDRLGVLPDELLEYYEKHAQNK